MQAATTVHACVQGTKSSKEKFAGALFTTTAEALVPTNGKGIQVSQSSSSDLNNGSFYVPATKAVRVVNLQTLIKGARQRHVGPGGEGAHFVGGGTGGASGNMMCRSWVRQQRGNRWGKEGLGRGRGARWWAH